MKGYQRKMICLKQTGSDYFEEAYFFLRRDREDEELDEEGLLKEANRIASSQMDVPKKQSHLSEKFLWGAWGMALACLVFAAILWVIW